MTFSIIVPLYNSQEFVSDAVKSVLSQTYSDWELIIVDDGSTDNSLKIAREWQQKDERIKVLQHEKGINRGVSATRNLGIKHARSNWLAMLDADDKWLPEKLQNDNLFLEQNQNVSLLYSRAEVIDENSKLITDSPQKKSLLNRTPIFGHGPSQITSFKDSIKYKWGVPTSSVIFQKETGRNYNFFNESTGDVEDFLLWYQLAEQGNICFRDGIDTHYRIHSQSWNAVNSDYRKLIPRRQKMYSYLLQSVKKENKGVVSRKLVTEGFSIILRSCLIKPYNDFDLILTSFKAIMKNNEIRSIDKFRSFFVVIREVLFIPVKLSKSYT